MNSDGNMSQPSSSYEIDPKVFGRSRGCCSCFGDCFRACLPCCFRRGRSSDSALQPLNVFQTPTSSSLEDLVEKSISAREAMWNKIGVSGAPIVSSTQSSAPKWPASRTAFRVVKLENGNVIISSDGLSDPFDDISLGELISASF